MAQDGNAIAQAATDAPASPPSATQECLLETLIEQALDSGRDRRPGRALRYDGWTPGRIRNFLERLAHCGVVAVAARAAGKSARSAYKLRDSAKGRAFAAAWDAAVRIALSPIPSEFRSRAIHGSVERILLRNGELWGECHRPDNRHAMATLTRLDKRALAQQDDPLVRLVVRDFDRFVEFAAASGSAADDYLARLAGNPDGEMSESANFTPGGPAPARTRAIGMPEHRELYPAEQRLPRACARLAPVTFGNFTLDGNSAASRVGARLATVDLTNFTGRGPDLGAASEPCMAAANKV